MEMGEKKRKKFVSLKNDFKKLLTFYFERVSSAQTKQYCVLIFLALFLSLSEPWQIDHQRKSPEIVPEVVLQQTVGTLLKVWIVLIRKSGRRRGAFGSGLALCWLAREWPLFLHAGVSSAWPWSSWSTVLVQRNSHTVRKRWPQPGLSPPPPPLLPHGSHICSPPFSAAVTLPSEWGGRRGAKSRGGKRVAHPERMQDKDGSTDILSTFISSAGGERRWIWGCFWQSHTMCSTDGAHVTIKSSPPHFHLPHLKSGTYGAGCQLLILYGN